MHEKFEGPGYHLTGKKITFASLWNQKGKKKHTTKRNTKRVGGAQEIMCESSGRSTVGYSNRTTVTVSIIVHWFLVILKLMA